MNKISQNLTRESFRHQEGKFIGADGLQLYYQSWHPQTTTKAIVIIVHASVRQTIISSGDFPVTASASVVVTDSKTS